MNSNRHTPRWLFWGGVALFVAWLFYSVSATYVVHKPFSAELLAAIRAAAPGWGRFTLSWTAVSRTLLDLAAAAWFGLLAVGLGGWLLRWLQARI